MKPVPAATESGWQSLDAGAAASLTSDPRRGLTATEAACRLQAYSPNTLQTLSKVPRYRVLFRQPVYVPMQAVWLPASSTLG